MHASLVVRVTVAAALATAGCARARPDPGSAPVVLPRNLTPGTPLTPAQRRWVERTLAGLPLRARVGQLTMAWVLGDFVNAQDPSFVETRRWIEVDGIGGVVMSLGSPIEVASKIGVMQDFARVPLLVASDLEPGLGRLKGGIFLPYLLTGGSATLVPSNMAIGATGRVDEALEAGRITGREARAIGILLAFAPTVDVNVNPANPVINIRSFGEDPALVAAMSAAFVRGLQESGVAATPKHFPGHGDTDTDSHRALPTVGASRARLDSVELVPFRSAFAAGAAGVMSAHVALPAIDSSGTPATLVPAILTGLLRDTLHFDGLVVTDALSMEGVGQGYDVARSAVLAVQAGADILLKPSDIPRAIDAVVAAVERGEISRARIDESVRRVLELKARLGLIDSRTPSLDAVREVVGAPAHRARMRELAERAVTLVRDRDSLVPFPPGTLVHVVSYAPETEIEAGRAFAVALRAAGARVSVTRIGPETGRAALDSIATRARAAERIVVTTHVRTIEGEGRFAVAPPVAAWIDTLARTAKVVVVAGGNPYVLQQFPAVGSYVAMWGIDPALESAAARAMMGTIPFKGRAPISLPGFFRRGDGLSAAVASR